MQIKGAHPQMVMEWQIMPEDINALAEEWRIEIQLNVSRNDNTLPKEKAQHITLLLSVINY